MKMHPAIIMVALVVGSQVAGLVGLVVAVPVAAIMRDIYLYLYRRFAEEYIPHDIEASLPSRQGEKTTNGRANERRELAEANSQPGIYCEDDFVEKLDKASVL